MEAETPATSSLLMLDQPRVIPIREGKRDYTFYFRRILQADWEQYFSGLYLSSRNEGVAQLNTTDFNSAGIELFESTLTRVVGYSRELTTPEDFKKVLPRHSVAVAGLLRSGGISDTEDDAPLDCDSIIALVDAYWSQTIDPLPGQPGQVTQYKGLLHRFAPPNVEQRKRYMRGGAISKVIGGTRKGSTTVYSLRNKLLLDLYDQLILSVEGYGVAGKPLEGTEQIRREMDAFHKAEAVAQLFNTQPEAAAEAA
jgi:hypothetical protein